MAQNPSSLVRKPLDHVGYRIQGPEQPPLLTQLCRESFWHSPVSDPNESPERELEEKASDSKTFSGLLLLSLCHLSHLLFVIAQDLKNWKSLETGIAETQLEYIMVPGALPQDVAVDHYPGIYHKYDSELAQGVWGTTKIIFLTLSTRWLSFPKQGVKPRQSASVLPPKCTMACLAKALHSRHLLADTESIYWDNRLTRRWFHWNVYAHLHRRERGYWRWLCRFWCWYW